MLKKWFLILLVLGASFSALALDDETLASGLNNPRHITFGPDGVLYIAEAGSGGETDVAGPFGPAKAGLSAQISAILPDGQQVVIVPELVSMDVGFGQIEGPMAVLVTEETYWVVLGQGPRDDTFGGAVVEAVVELDRETLETRRVIDLRAFEEENNPDQADEVVANPADLAAAPDGTLYIADASANAVLRWTAEDGLELFAAWPVSDDAPSAVPTAVAVGPDGDLYVGFLSGFPFPAGGARIERYNAGGELQQTYDGLTLVTDVLVAADGSLYAVELASGFGDTGYNPASGRIVRVADGGLEVIAEGLNFPYGLAMDAEGSLYVTVDSAFAAPDSGRVIRLGGM
jgi:hypothetical protein